RQEDLDQREAAGDGSAGPPALAPRGAATLRSGRHLRTGVMEGVLPPGSAPAAPGSAAPPGRPLPPVSAASSFEGSARYCTTSIDCGPRPLSSHVTCTVTRRTAS